MERHRERERVKWRGIERERVKGRRKGEDREKEKISPLIP